MGDANGTELFSVWLETADERTNTKVTKPKTFYDEMRSSSP